MRFPTLFSAAVLVVGVGCSGCDFPRAGSGSPPNVILIMIDTLRADHMGTYGYQRDTTPFLDGLAEGSVVFERARSQAACTFPSVNSLLTSRYSFDFYTQEAGEMGIPPRFPSPAEVLEDEGYRTIAVSASPIVRNTASKENPGAGFGRGFDVFDELAIGNRRLSAEGVGLRRVLRGEPATLRYAFTDQSMYRAADDGRKQLILDGIESTATLFDLRTDPLAQHNLFSRGNPDVDRLGGALNEWLRETGQWVNFDAALAAAKAKEDELRALGYLR